MRGRTGPRRGSRGPQSPRAPRVLVYLTTVIPVGIFSNMRARPLLRRRVVLAPDAFVEVIIWRVPRPVPPSTHGFKYRLAYVVGGECVVRYDNERGKGDHRHVGRLATRYRFSTPDRLMADFGEDIARWNHEHGRA